MFKAIEIWFNLSFFFTLVRFC